MSQQYVEELLKWFTMLTDEKVKAEIILLVKNLVDKQ